MEAVGRAGFSLSTALFRKMCGPLTWAPPDGVTPIFPEKTGDLFGHHCRFYSFHSGVIQYFRHVAVLQKFAGPLVGAPFCGAPVRPNLNPPLAVGGS